MQKQFDFSESVSTVCRRLPSRSCRNLKRRSTRSRRCSSSQLVFFLSEYITNDEFSLLSSYSSSNSYEVSKFCRWPAAIRKWARGRRRFRLWKPTMATFTASISPRSSTCPSSGPASFPMREFRFWNSPKKWKSNFSDLISAFHAAWTQEAMHLWGSCQSRSFERNHFGSSLSFRETHKNKALIFMLFSQACKVTSNSNFKFPEK